MTKEQFDREKKYQAALAVARERRAYLWNALFKKLPRPRGKKRQS